MSERRLVPIVAIGGGAASLALAYFYRREIVKAGDHAIDLVMPTKTGWRKVDAILPSLKAAAVSSGIPLGLLVGWIAKESGGRLADTTNLDERGYFQLMPAESQKLGLDHQRLSTDSDYSISSGIALIQDYMKRANALGIAPKGSSYYWRLVKLLHSMGAGAVDKIVKMTPASNAGSWDALEKYAIDNDAAILHATKHSGKKWFPFVDEIYRIGQPFGFGGDQNIAGTSANVGAVLEGRLSGDYEALARALESELCGRSPDELRAAAWAIRNRADSTGVAVADMLAPGGDFGSVRKTSGYLSTRYIPTARSIEIAREVLDASKYADFTNGAVDFWMPADQSKMYQLGDIYRDAIRNGDTNKAEKYERYSTYGSEDDVREQQKNDGLRTNRIVGALELLERIS